jgi:hypothetical protein
MHLKQPTADVVNTNKSHRLQNQISQKRGLVHSKNVISVPISSNFRIQRLCFQSTRDGQVADLLVEVEAIKIYDLDKDALEATVGPLLILLNG